MSESRDSFFRCHGIFPGETFWGAINLDGLTETDLEIVKDCSELHSLVRTYAATFLKAREQRLVGNIEKAIIYERDLETIYNHLPRKLIW